MGNNVGGVPHILPVYPQGQLPAVELEASRLAEVVLHVPLAHTLPTMSTAPVRPTQGLLTPTKPSIPTISITKPSIPTIYHLEAVALACHEHINPVCRGYDSTHLKGKCMRALRHVPLHSKFGGSFCPQQMQMISKLQAASPAPARQPSPLPIKAGDWSYQPCLFPFAWHGHCCARHIQIVTQIACQLPSTVDEDATREPT